MATGGGREFRKTASTDPRTKRAWQRTTSTSDKEDNLSLNSIPNDLRPNNWDFSDWKPNPALDNTKRRKKGNPEREREQSLSQDSPPPSERHQRTPSTFPRTRITPSTPTSQRLALEKLKQRMTFSDFDDVSNDGERNNERSIPPRRPKLENYTRQDTSSTEGATAAKPLQDEGEHSHIVSRLMQIREYIKQANSMRDALSKSGNPMDLGKATKFGQVIASLREQESAYLEILQDFWQASKEDLDKVVSLCESLQQQEKAYTALLQQSLHVKGDNIPVGDVNQREETPPNPESMEDNYSLDFEVQSETSEATTFSIENSPREAKRPRIEDKLGLSDGDEDNDDMAYPLADGSPGSNTMDNTLIERPGVSTNLDLESGRNEDSEEIRKNEMRALRQQQELLKKLIQQQEQMRQLRGRQTALIALQRDAEQQLAEAKARNNQAAARGHNQSGFNQNLTPNNPTDDSFTSLSENRRLVMQAIDNNPQTTRNTTAELPRELLEIRQHLNILKNELKEQNPETAERQSNPELEAASGATAQEDNRKQLQDKLLDLQDKKQRMDSLLQELQNLRNQRYDAILNNSMPPEVEEPPVLTPSSSAAQLAEQRAALDDADDTVSNAQDVLDILDAQEKIKKLQEVKERLNQLRSLVQYYQSADQSGNPPDIDERTAFLAQLESGQDLLMERNIRPGTVEQGAVGGVQASVVREAVGGMKSDEDNRSEDSRTSETESHLSSLGPWGDDPEIQEKVRKLKEAKEKLKQLQDLVSHVQQSPDAARALPDLAELARTLEDPMSTHTTQAEAMSEGEIPAHMTQPERDSFYEAKMQEQLRELNELKNERQRLLTIQQELQSLQGRYTEVPDEEEIPPKPGMKKRTRLVQPVEEDDSGQDKENQRPIRPNPPVVKFSSNDEVYGKMRKQRMLREELRQKKRELEAIMKKDKKNYSKNQDNQSDTVSFSTDMYGASMSADATMATWGGSTVDNLESITEDNDANDKDDEDEDDAYPSDGIIQVEEEEEENDSDNNTYTIEDDVRQRRQARSQRQPVGQDRKRRTFPRSQRQQKDGTKPKQPWSKYSKRGQRRQENYRSAQELMEDDEQTVSKQLDSPNAPYEVFQQQLQRTASMCQSLIGEQNQSQQSMGLLQTGSLTSPAGYSYRSSGQMPDMMQQQLQQQQLIMNLSQCLQQMSMQQLEIQNLQRQMQGLTLQQDMGSTLAIVPDDMRMRSMTSLPTAGDSRGLSPNVGLTLPRPDSFSLQPQFPSSFHTRRSADNLLSTQTLEDSVFETDRQSGQPAHKAQSLDGRKRHEQYLMSRYGPQNARRRTQMERSERMSARHTDQQPRREDDIPPLNLRHKKKKSSSQQTPSNWSIPSDPRETRVTDNTGARRSAADIVNNLAQRNRELSQRSGEEERPGLSAGISGAGFGETGSMMSSVSSRLQVEASRNKQDTREEEDTGDLTSFEALRESIYAEVAALISQNENRPHFLIELFRELQMLTSDYLKQRVLYAVRDVVSKFLTDQQNSSNPATAPLPVWINCAAVGNCTTSELTPSESILTSDEEEIKIRDLTAAEKKIYGRVGSLDADQFDYVENADNDSTLSTPSNSYWDNPFARDTLGDTAINLDKALKRVKESEARLAEARNQSHDSAAVSRQLSEPTSSSAVDQGSESSAASMSYSRIDTQQLNQQIKMIMKEIIPVIKEHIDNVCSSQLLAYIKRLVLSLTRQYDSSQYAMFFHTQLGSALHDTLAKFEGRKLRVCGEDLLVEMSEVLFNELAFFRLMQGLGETPSAVPSQQQRTSSTQTKDEVEMVDDVDDEEEQTQESDTTESTATEDEGDPNMNNSIRLNAAEEEDLGKLRDDEFASEVLIQDGDEKDDDAESHTKSSAVQIELAVSETKPFTRIGSDEDDEDADESQSADDPSETAVSRDAMMEKSQSIEDGDDNMDVMPEEEAPVGDTDADQGAISSSGASTQQVVHMNGEVVENGEITIEDLPNSLNIQPSEDIQAKIQEEQESNEGAGAVLVSMLSMEELAGDPFFLKEPE